MLTSKLIDGTFPDYERVIRPATTRCSRSTPREFASAVDRVATIATEKTRAVKLSARPGHADRIGEQSGKWQRDRRDGGANYGAAPLEIGFNARYLLDITRQIEGDELPAS